MRIASILTCMASIMGSVGFAYADCADDLALLQQGAPFVQAPATTSGIADIKGAKVSRMTAEQDGSPMTGNRLDQPASMDGLSRSALESVAIVKARTALENGDEVGCMTALRSGHVSMN